MAQFTDSELVEMLFTGRDSDIIIICGGHVYHVHASILSEASDFFKALFRNECKERTQKFINFPEENPMYLARLLEHAYLRRFIDIQSERLQPSPLHGFHNLAPPEFDTLVQVYYLADKYLFTKTGPYTLAKITDILAGPRHPPILIGSDGFILGLSKMFSTSVLGEDSLRTMMLKYLEENAASVDQCVALRDLLVDHVPEMFSFGTGLNEKLTQCDDEIKDLKKQLRDAEQTINRLRAEKDQGDEWANRQCTLHRSTDDDLFGRGGWIREY